MNQELCAVFHALLGRALPEPLARIARASAQIHQEGPVDG
jgi:hypothetical protein